MKDMGQGKIQGAFSAVTHAGGSLDPDVSHDPSHMPCAWSLVSYLAVHLAWNPARDQARRGKNLELPLEPVMQKAIKGHVAEMQLVHSRFIQRLFLPGFLWDLV